MSQSNSPNICDGLAGRCRRAEPRWTAARHWVPATPIRVAVAGLNGRGGAHVGAFAGMKGVQIVYLIDPDTRTYAKRLKNRSTPRPATSRRPPGRPQGPGRQEPRCRLHRHAQPLARADDHLGLPGRQGRLRREAVQPQRPRRPHRRRDGPQVQPHRAARHPEPQRQQLGQHCRHSSKSGKLGKLLVSRGLCYKPRNSIGIKPNAKPPAEVDFNIWLGRPRSGPSTPTWSITTGTGSGTSATATSATRASTRWTWPAGPFPAPPCRGASISLGGRFGYTGPGRDRQHADRRLRLRRHAADLRGARPEDRRLPQAEGRQHLPLRGGHRGRQQVLPQGQGHGRAAAGDRGHPTRPRRRQPLRQLHRRRPQPQDEPTSTPTSSKATIPAPCATWPTSPIAWATGAVQSANQGVRRQQGSCTRRWPGWRSTWPRTTA